MRKLVVNEEALNKLLEQWRHAHEFIIEERSYDYEAALAELDKDEQELRSELYVAEIAEGSVLGEALMIEYTPPSE